MSDWEPFLVAYGTMLGATAEIAQAIAACFSWPACMSTSSSAAVTIDRRRAPENSRRTTRTRSS